MTSLTALAQGADAAAPPFNSTFYLAAATIIPILFLAFAVQGPAYQNLMQNYATLGERIETIERTETTGRLPSRRWWGTTLTVALLTAVILAIPVLGVMGEIAALYALYNQQIWAGGGQVVFLGVILLLLATAIGPVLTWIKHWPFPGGPPLQPETDTITITEPQPEPDKTDPA